MRPLRAAALREFLAAQIARAKDEDVLFSVHLKATMMKVSDLIIFGRRARSPRRLRAVRRAARRRRPQPHDGPPASWPPSMRRTPSEGREGLREGHRRRPRARDGRLRQGHHQPARAVRHHRRRLDAGDDPHVGPHVGSGRRRGRHAGGDPGLSYAGIYQVVLDDCRANGAFDPATMGSVPNVGLMAQAAEEYGLHDKTFEIPTTGTVRAVDTNGDVLLEHVVSKGDIYRMCQTKDVPIRDWVKLAVTRARATGSPAVLARRQPRPRPQPDRQGQRVPLRAGHRRPRHPDPARRGDRVLLGADPQGRGHDPVTGNVLRDYLTDLFPILELGTSAKMLSVVPLINGRPVRDRRRRLGACWSRSSWSRRTTCAGTARRVRAGGQLRAPRAEHRQRPRRSWPTPRPGDRHVPRREQVAGAQGRSDRQPGSHFYWSPTAPVSWRSRPTTPSSRRTCAAGRGALVRRAADQRRADRGPAARRRGWVLLPRRRQGRRGRAVEDQRGPASLG